MTINAANNLGESAFRGSEDQIGYIALTLIHYICSQEFCLDVFQPSGAGRKKRDLVTKHGVTTLLDTEGPTGEAVLVRNPEELVKRESSRQKFFEAAKTHTSNSKSASIGDNVGVTVILPGETKREVGKLKIGKKGVIFIMGMG